MARPIEIDTRGFNSMIRSLKSYTNQNTRTVVRAMTNEVLLLASAGTRVASKTQIKANVGKRLRLPLNTPSTGDLVGLTKSGNVWISQKDARLKNQQAYGQKNAKSFLLVKKGMKSLPNKVPRTIPWKGGRKLPERTIQALTRALSEAHKEQKREEKHRLRSVQGLGSASFLYLIKMLGLKRRTHSKIKANTYNAMNKLGKATQALKAFEQLTGRDNASITLYSAVQSALAPRGGNGIRAFANAMNAKTNEFKHASKVDVGKFALRFAKRNGFDIRL